MIDKELRRVNKIIRKLNVSEDLKKEDETLLRGLLIYIDALKTRKKLMKLQNKRQEMIEEREVRHKEVFRILSALYYETGAKEYTKFWRD